MRVLDFAVSPEGVEDQLLTMVRAWGWKVPSLSTARRRLCWRSGTTSRYPRTTSSSFSARCAAPGRARVGLTGPGGAGVRRTEATRKQSAVELQILQTLASSDRLLEDENATQVLFASKKLSDEMQGSRAAIARVPHTAHSCARRREDPRRGGAAGGRG
jgi:hypothetical protein